MKHSNIFKYVAGVARFGLHDFLQRFFGPRIRCLPFHRKNI